MAVEVVYRSSRDQERLFMDKAEVDHYDKTLEPAGTLTEMLQKAAPLLKEGQVEELGIFMTKNRGALARAFKNQPDTLNGLSEENAADE